MQTSEWLLSLEASSLFFSVAVPSFAMVGPTLLDADILLMYLHYFAYSISRARQQPDVEH